MTREDKKQQADNAQNGQRKVWVKPTVVSAPVRDYTEDGYNTGTDGFGPNTDS